MPEISPDEQFQKVLTIAARQVQNGKILIRFGPTGGMRFIIDEASLKESLSGSGLEDKSFRQIFHSEVGAFLEAIVRGITDRYILDGSPFLSDVRSDPKTKAVRQEKLRERMSLIEKALVTPELRARYLVKMSSKHPRLRSSGWEVAKKLELSTREPWLQPYLTLSFEAVRPEAQGLSWLPFFAGEAVGHGEYLSFDCDEGDVDDLIEALQAAKAALHQAK